MDNNKCETEQIEIKEAELSDGLLSVLESLLFAAGEPLKLRDIALIVNCTASKTKKLLEELRESYHEPNRGLQLISSDDTYQLVTKSCNSNYVQKLLKTNKRQSLSQAALETLAIIAYKQPVTRVEIDEIRGVKSDRAVVNLLDKGLIKESGRLEVPGRPILYSTTEEFLKYFGLESVNQMPIMDMLTSDMKMDVVEYNNEENETSEEK